MSHKRNHRVHARRRENDRRWFKQHPEAIPTLCQVCGRAKSLEFHHDNYDKPRIGRFVCKECHDKIHGIGENK